MKRFRNHLIGIDRGSILLFSDFEDDGAMWTGQGPRLIRRTVPYSEPFRGVPQVFVTMEMWDIDNGTNQRVDLSADAIGESSFDVLFKTWGDTRIARVRVGWMAMGELAHGDDWDLS